MYDKDNIIIILDFFTPLGQARRCATLIQLKLSPLISVVLKIKILLAMLHMRFENGTSKI